MFIMMTIKFKKLFCYWNLERKNRGLLGGAISDQELFEKASFKKKGAHGPPSPPDFGGHVHF